MSVPLVLNAFSWPKVAMNVPQAHSASSWLKAAMSVPLVLNAFSWPKVVTNVLLAHSVYSWPKAALIA